MAEIEFGIPSPIPLSIGNKHDWYDFNLLMVSHGDDLGEFEGSDRAGQFRSDWQSIIHERVHWMQQFGTTVGGFLSLAKYDRTSSGIRNLKNLEPSLRHDLLKSRRRIDGTPIIPVVRSTLTLSLLGAELDLSVDILQQIWYDNWWTWNIFYDANLFINGRPYKDQERICALAIRDAALRGATLDPENPNFNKHIPIPTIRFITHNESRIKYYKIGTPFTYVNRTIPTYNVAVRTTNIFEGSAVGNEILFLFRARAPEEYIKTRLRNVLTQEAHGLALQLFMDIFEFDIKSLYFQLPQSIATFVLLCDIALNPPLPPFHYTDDLVWDEIYPPQRFLDMLTKIAGAPYLLDNLDSHESVVEASKELTRRMRFWQHTEAVPPKTNFSGEFDFEGTVGCFPWDIKYHDFDEGRINAFFATGFPMYFYQLWLQERMWAVRHTQLHKVVFPGHAMGEFASLGSRNSSLIVHEQILGDPVLLRPPLRRLKSGELTCAMTVDPNFVYWLSYESFREYITDQLFYSVGKPNFGNFPKHVFEPFLERLREEFASGLGESPW